MNDNNLTISVALCSYNGERYLAEQLTSIIRQSLLPDEIVLLDDCSSDNTVSVAEQTLEHSGIPYRILVNDHNYGVFKSFQKCIQECKGDVIFTADQDDVWVPEKIECMMTEYYQDKDVVFVFSDGKITDENLIPVAESFWTSLNLRRGGLCDHVSQEKYRQLLMYYWAVPGTMMSFRRQLSDKAFPIPPKKGWLHDSWLAINAPVYGKAIAIDSPLTLYRQHGNNTVGAKANQRNKQEEDICQAQKVLFYLKCHADQLQNLLDTKGEEMPTDYHRQLEKYISLFRKMEHYESDGSLKKVLFLITRILDNGMAPFDLSRADMLTYLASVIFRKQP